MLLTLNTLRAAPRLSRSFSSQIKTLTVSDFITDRLYAKGHGYFSKPDNQLGTLGEAIPFTELFGYEDYSKILAERYPKNAWLTPSEIFRPYYGMTIASYIDTQRKAEHELDPSTKGLPLKILEAGAGNGTAAASILNFFKLFRPQTYRTMQYTIVEISEAMISRCRATLTKLHPQLIASGQIKFVNCGIRDYPHHCTDTVFLIMLEVLDNMPHERVYFDENQEPTGQAMVQMNSDNPDECKEVINKVLDRSTLELFKMWRDINSQQESVDRSSKYETLVTRLYKSMRRIHQTDNVFLPTYCYQTIQNLHKVLPQAKYILSDFDMLREAPTAGSGFNAPTVSTKLEASDAKKDYDSYLVPRGAADIFFPTNFRLLRLMHQKTTGNDSEFLKTWEFVERYSDKNWAATKSGYNPLKEDFLNTSFFISQTK